MDKKLSSSELHDGPIRHPSLPGGFVDRIKTFKAILGDADSVSLEKTIDAFTRDAHPEAELVLWERIANTFKLFLQHNPNANQPEGRKEILAVLLGASMGREEWTILKHLTQAQIKHLVVSYRGISAL